MIDSPKVATYDLKPEMSAIEVAEKVAEEIRSGKFPFVMNNFANPDMVGHTGKFDAAVKAIETTDKAIGIIYEACKENGYILFITSDHGNAEQMRMKREILILLILAILVNIYLNKMHNFFYYIN